MNERDVEAERIFRRRRSASVLAIDLTYDGTALQRNQPLPYQFHVELLKLVETLILAASGSMIAKTGDGFYAEFDDHDSCLKAAIDVIQRVDENKAIARAGIEVGEIIAAEDGQYYGHAIVVSSRLMEQADPWGILVSNGFYNLLEKTDRARFNTYRRFSETSRIGDVSAHEYFPERADMLAHEYVPDSVNIETIYDDDIPEEIFGEAAFTSALPASVQIDAPNPIVLRDADYFHRGLSERMSQLIELVGSPERGGQQGLVALKQRAMSYQEQLGSSLQDTYLTGLLVEGRSLKGQLQLDRELQNLNATEADFERSPWPKHIHSKLSDIIDLHEDFLKNDRAEKSDQPENLIEQTTRDDTSVLMEIETLFGEIESDRSIISDDAAALIRRRIDRARDAVLNPNEFNKTDIRSLRATLHNLIAALSKFMMKRLEQMKIATYESERSGYKIAFASVAIAISGQFRSVLSFMQRSIEVLENVRWDVVARLIKELLSG